MKSQGSCTDIEDVIFGELKIPSRSRFYHLKPVGIGTPFVESLSGYVARLAQEHFVTPTVLLREVIPLADTLKMMTINFSCFHRAVNGSGVIASSFIKALKTLTLRQDISCTTMVTWTHILPHHSLIRAKRAWCPVCYETWREANTIIYDPLLWALESVTVCPLHEVFLTTSCPNCNEHLLHLSSRSCPGFCPHCKAWLGLSHDEASANMSLGSEEDIEWQLWKANASGELLANAAAIFIPAREIVSRSLRYCIDNFSIGRVSYFASQFEFPLKRVQGWLRGERIPVLETLLKLTFRMNIPLLTFLCAGFENKENAPKKFNSSETASGRPLARNEVIEVLKAAACINPPQPLQAAVRATGWGRWKLEHQFPELCTTILARYAQVFYKRIDKERAFHILQDALEENPPPSMVEVAGRVGCHAVSLTEYYPDITKKIVARYKNYWHNTDWNHVESFLKEMLSRESPNSMNETARSIGISARVLRRKFPELCKAISRKFEEHNRIVQEARKEKLRQEIFENVAAMVSTGVYPSIKRVAAQIKTSRNIFEIRLILAEVKRSISLHIPLANL